jgi:hypothetical protein
MNTWLASTGILQWAPTARLLGKRRKLYLEVALSQYRELAPELNPEALLKKLKQDKRYRKIGYQIDANAVYTASSWVILRTNVHFPNLPKLQTPVWGQHVSVVLGESLPSHSKNLNDGEEITFEYEACLKTSKNYYWSRVRSLALQNFRKELGLVSIPKTQFHITFGSVA